MQAELKNGKVNLIAKGLLTYYLLKNKRDRKRKNCKQEVERKTYEFEYFLF